MGTSSGGSDGVVAVCLSSGADGTSCFMSVFF